MIISLLKKYGIAYYKEECVLYSFVENHRFPVLNGSNMCWLFLNEHLKISNAFLKISSPFQNPSQLLLYFIALHA